MRIPCLILLRTAGIYDAPDTKNVKEANLGGLKLRYEYEYSNTDTVNLYLNQPMPYHSVLTIEKA